MANTSIGGLVSGLDTASIISQLMTLESQPKTNLQTKVTGEQRAINALQTFNAKLASIVTRAAELAKSTAWSGVSATSSNEKVSVAADAGATPATLDFNVNKVATRSVLDLGTRALTDQMTDNGATKVSFTKPDGTTVELETGDGTVQGFVNALNGGAHGATATLVNLGNGSYRLNVTASTTGAKTIAVNAPIGSTMAVTGTLTQGQKASITVGADTITSDSNTFTDLMPGVDVTLTSGATGPTTVSLSIDRQSMADKVKGLVDAVNSALTEASNLTGYNTTTKTAGLLGGDPMVRGAASRLLDAVIGGIGGSSLASLGIQSDRTGKLSFDEAKFKAAYGADPSGVAAKFTAPKDPLAPGAVVGLASKLETLAKSFSDATDGTVSLAIKGRTQVVDRMETDIASWDVRLEQRRTALERQYGALEVALGKLQSQSSWLAGQINSLPQMSSGS